MDEREKEEAEQKEKQRKAKILADEKTEPIYSIGKANRYVQTGEFVTIPKDTPGPIYTPADEAYYKFRYALSG